MYATSCHTSSVANPENGGICDPGTPVLIVAAIWLSSPP
jgi:hypothetical protein